jgi:predicted DNA-binding transcriptional regulator AlpA
MTTKGREVKLAPGVYLTTAQVAEHLGLTRSGLRGLRQRGEGPAWFRLSSRAIRYKVEDILAWVESRKGSTSHE